MKTFVDSPFILCLLFALLFCPLAFIPAQGQELKPTQIKFLEKNAVPVLEKGQPLDKQWPDLKKILADKRIILLGEFTHGAKEIFQLKNEWMKYLHQELGFDVLLVESGMGELMAVNLQKDSLTARQMTYGLIGPWRTEANGALMQWVKSEQLDLAGFDVQRSGQSFQDVLKMLRSLPGWDTERLIQLELQFTIVAKRLRQEKYENVKDLTLDLIRRYQELIETLSPPNNGLETELASHTQRTLINRKEFLRYYLQFSKDRDFRRRWEARDSMMADNVRWLLTEVYPGKKVMISAHNFHIAQYNEKEEVMGEMLKEAFGDQMYSIGVFAGAGVLANNSRMKETLASPSTDHLDIKHVIRYLKAPFHFLPISSQRKEGDEWLYEPIVVNDSFIDLNGSNKMVLARHFDALLLIDKVSMPEFDY